MVWYQGKSIMWYQGTSIMWYRVFKENDWRFASVLLQQTWSNKICNEKNKKMCLIAPVAGHLLLLLWKKHAATRNSPSFTRDMVCLLPVCHPIYIIHQLNTSRLHRSHGCSGKKPINDSRGDYDYSCGHHASHHIGTHPRPPSPASRLGCLVNGHMTMERNTLHQYPPPLPPGWWGAELAGNMFFSIISTKYTPYTTLGAAPLSPGGEGHVGTFVCDLALAIWYERM